MAAAHPGSALAACRRSLRLLNSQRPTSNSQEQRPPGTMVRLKPDTTAPTSRSGAKAGDYRIDSYKERR
jgi:hypothetical protein